MAERNKTVNEIWALNELTKFMYEEIPMDKFDLAKPPTLEFLYHVYGFYFKVHSGMIGALATSPICRFLAELCYEMREKAISDAYWYGYTPKNFIISYISWERLQKMKKERDQKITRKKRRKH